jgi:hypothetical protein
MRAQTTLIFAPQFDTDGHDATGAFQPEAYAFCDFHGLPRDTVHLFDNRAALPDRRAQVTALMSGRLERAETFALFSHGWKTGVQPGWVMGVIHKMAAALNMACVNAPTVILYCCSTGKDGDNQDADDVQAGPGGEGGFADALRDDMVRLGMRPTIYAHTCRGHTTTNAFVRRFDHDQIAGGEWIIEPHTELWSAWERAINPIVTRGKRRFLDPVRTLRFRFPFMSQAEIEAELHASLHGHAE